MTYNNVWKDDFMEIDYESGSPRLKSQRGSSGFGTKINSNYANIVIGDMDDVFSSPGTSTLVSPTHTDSTVQGDSPEAKLVQPRHPSWLDVDDDDDGCELEGDVWIATIREMEMMSDEELLNKVVYYANSGTFLCYQCPCQKPRGAFVQKAVLSKPYGSSGVSGAYVTSPSLGTNRRQRGEHRGEYRGERRGSAHVHSVASSRESVDSNSPDHSLAVIQWLSTAAVAPPDPLGHTMLIEPNIKHLQQQSSSPSISSPESCPDTMNPNNYDPLSTSQPVNSKSENLPHTLLADSDYDQLANLETDSFNEILTPTQFCNPNYDEFTVNSASSSNNLNNSLNLNLSYDQPSTSKSATPKNLPLPQNVLTDLSYAQPSTSKSVPLSQNKQATLLLDPLFNQPSTSQAIFDFAPDEPHVDSVSVGVPADSSTNCTEQDHDDGLYNPGCSLHGHQPCTSSPEMRHYLEQLRAFMPPDLVPDTTRDIEHHPHCLFDPSNSYQLHYFLRYLLHMQGRGEKPEWPYSENNPPPMPRLAPIPHFPGSHYVSPTSFHMLQSLFPTYHADIFHRIEDAYKRIHLLMQLPCDDYPKLSRYRSVEVNVFLPDGYFVSIFINNDTPLKELKKYLWEKFDSLIKEQLQRYAERRSRRSGNLAAYRFAREQFSKLMRLRRSASFSGSTRKKKTNSREQNGLRSRSGMFGSIMSHFRGNSTTLETSMSALELEALSSTSSPQSPPEEIEELDEISETNSVTTKKCFANRDQHDFSFQSVSSHNKLTEFYDDRKRICDLPEMPPLFLRLVELIGNQFEKELSAMISTMLGRSLNQLEMYRTDEFLSYRYAMHWHMEQAVETRQKWSIDEQIFYHFPPEIDEIKKLQLSYERFRDMERFDNFVHDDDAEIASLRSFEYSQYPSPEVSESEEKEREIEAKKKQARAAARALQGHYTEVYAKRSNRIRRRELSVQSLPRVRMTHSGKDLKVEIKRSDSDDLALYRVSPGYRSPQSSSRPFRRSTDYLRQKYGIVMNDDEPLSPEETQRRKEEVKRRAEWQKRVPDLEKLKENLLKKEAARIVREKERRHREAQDRLERSKVDKVDLFYGFRKPLRPRSKMVVWSHVETFSDAFGSVGIKLNKVIARLKAMEEDSRNLNNPFVLDNPYEAGPSTSGYNEMVPDMSSGNYWCDSSGQEDEYDDKKDEEQLLSENGDSPRKKKNLLKRLFSRRKSKPSPTHKATEPETNETEYGPMSKRTDPNSDSTKAIPQSVGANVESQPQYLILKVLCRMLTQLLYQERVSCKFSPRDIKFQSLYQIIRRKFRSIYLKEVFDEDSDVTLHPSLAINLVTIDHLVLHLNPNEFVLKICGVDQFLVGEYELADFEFVRNTISKGKVPHLELVNKEVVMKSMGVYKYIEPSFLRRMIHTPLSAVACSMLGHIHQNDPDGCTFDFSDEPRMRRRMRQKLEPCMECEKEKEEEEAATKPPPEEELLQVIIENNQIKNMTPEQIVQRVLKVQLNQNKNLPRDGHYSTITHVVTNGDVDGATPMLEPLKQKASDDKSTPIEQPEKKLNTKSPRRVTFACKHRLTTKHETKDDEKMELYEDSFYMERPYNSYSLDQWITRGIANQKLLSVWKLNSLFRLRVMLATYVNVRDAEHIYAMIGLFHGTDQLCTPRTTTKVSTMNPRWDQLVEFPDMILFDLPLATRLSITLIGESHRKRPHERWVIGWINLPVFNSRHLMISGRLSLSLWNKTATLDGYLNPSGTLGANPNRFSAPRLQIEFDSFPMPVVYPSFQDCIEYGYVANKYEFNVRKELTQIVNTNPINTTIKLDSLEYFNKCNVNRLVRDCTKGWALKQLKSLLLKSDPLLKLTEQEKDFFWRERHLIQDVAPDALPNVLESARWSNREEVSQCYSLLKTWPTVSVDTALLLLTNRFPDPEVRNFAIRSLDENLTDGLMLHYLLQFVQLLRNEPFLVNELSCMLLRRALLNRRFGNLFFWHIRSQMDESPLLPRWCVLLEMYLRGLPRSALLATYTQVCSLEEIERISKETIDDTDRKGSILRLLKAEDVFQTVNVFCNPLDITVRLADLQLKKLRVMDSAKRPLWLEWKNRDKLALHSGLEMNAVIFKSGDDLRQDMLTLQLLRIMDLIWRREGFDLRLLPYNCLATGDQVGLIEVVPNSKTVMGIQRVGGRMAALQVDSSKLHKWIREWNRDNYEGAIDNFTRSCAGYCVATFILGIGDRNPDNIMVNQDGQIFHIDFGHFLGHFKKKFGISRERVPFVLTYDFLQVISKGSENPLHSKEFAAFQQLCRDAYGALHDNASLLIALFTMMLGTGIPELQTLEDVYYLRQTLQIGKDRNEAIQYFESQLDEAHGGAWTTKIDWFFHHVNH